MEDWHGYANNDRFGDGLHHASADRLQSAGELFPQQPELVGPIWELTQLDGMPVVPGTTITAEFDDTGRVGGSAGCNSYGGPYTVSDPKISIGPLMSTQMACIQPVMDQEIDYLAALQVAKTYGIDGEELTLYDADGDALAVYTVTDQGLAGTSWEVIAYNNGKEAVVSVIIGTEITADFGEDGQVTGSAGCNHYFGPYQTEGDTISMGPFGMTEMFCQEPEGLMEQESAYLAALETAATYKIEGINMEMRTAEGALVGTFHRTMAAPAKAEAAVTGTVTYRQRIALPEDAVVTVQIRDVSLMDAPAKVVGEEVIHTDGKQVPIPYAVAYDPDEIDERNTYSMFVRIEDGAGKLLFISDTSVPVITHGNPTKDVEIVVVPAG